MSHLGLICLMIKCANQTPAPAPSLPNHQLTSPPGSMLGSGIHGALMGGGLGAGLGGLYGYMTAPDEVDEQTGQPKSKWDHTLSHMGTGAALGAGFGGLGGAAQGFDEKRRHMDWLGHNYPATHDHYVQNFKPENVTQDYLASLKGPK